MSIILAKPQELLEDHIDEPIKKCVVGMALLGFRPVMSCCGFNYKNEKVPKKHLQKAYMYLFYPDLIKDNLGTLLLEIAMRSGWSINPLFNSDFVDFYAATWEKNHPWNDSNCPHFYEKFVLSISNLEKTLLIFREKFKNEAIIYDGNSYYKDSLSIKYWQYEPTKEWIVTPETFDRL